MSKRVENFVFVFLSVSLVAVVFCLLLMLLPCDSLLWLPIDWMPTRCILIDLNCMFV